MGVRAGSGHCGKHCTGFNEIPTVSLDSSWPALRPTALEVLKLSVNGEELNTLRGARSLLSKRHICTILVHVTKCQRDWMHDLPDTDSKDVMDGGSSSNTTELSMEFWDLLTNVGGLEVSLHLD